MESKYRESAKDAGVGVESMVCMSYSKSIIRINNESMKCPT